MLARKYRLPHFIRFTRSPLIRHPFFSVRIGKSNLPYSRFGFIISKKIDKRATVRNRLKRRFRGCIEQLTLFQRPGKDVLFILKKESISESSEILLKHIQQVLCETKIL